MTFIKIEYFSFNKSAMKPISIILMITIGLTSCMRSQMDKQRPNILFCIWDDASAHMSAYGYDWCKTPSFDEIAKGFGMYD